MRSYYRDTRLVTDLTDFYSLFCFKTFTDNKFYKKKVLKTTAPTKFLHPSCTPYGPIPGKNCNNLEQG